MTRLACLLLYLTFSSNFPLLRGVEVPVAGGGVSIAGAASVRTAPTNFQGVVTWVDEGRKMLFLQDGSQAMALRVDMASWMVHVGEAELKLDQVCGLSNNRQGSDIGQPTLGGSFDTGPETLVVRGAGYDTWAGADLCYFVQKLMTGEAEIAVHVAGINGGSQAKAGVMMRNSLDSRSPWAGVMFTPVGRVGLQSRREPGNNASGNLFSQPVEWLKLARQRRRRCCAGRRRSARRGWTQ